MYHLTARGRTSWHGFAEAIVAHRSVEKKPLLTPIRGADYPLPADRPAHSALACDKFTASFCALPGWESALAQCLDQSGECAQR
nr:sugar nucleotide-binding protein [Massilia glaciei]